MEYNNCNDKIIVYNLPLFDNPPLDIIEIKDLRGITNLSLQKFINLVEFSLFDIIDPLFKRSLKYYTDDYYICGGKAITDLISNEIKSFDFDIHVKEKEDIDKISKFIVTNMKKEINQFYRLTIRKKIYSILLKINAIDSNLREYYMTDDLFYYGERINRINSFYKINSIYIKLKLKNKCFLYKDMKINYTNSEKDLPKISDDILNIIYIPISDISDDKFNFGIELYKLPNLIYRDNLKKINYASFPILIFNLLKYICKNSNKRVNNIKKLKMINKPLNHNCNFSKTYDLEKFNKEFRYIIGELSKYKSIKLNEDANFGLNQIIIDKKILLLKNDTTYYTIINELVNNILNFRNYKMTSCDIKLDDFNNIIFKDNINLELRYEKLEELVFKYDQSNNNHYILRYTSTFYQHLNLYCSYINNDLPIHIKPIKNDAFTKIITLSNGKKINCNVKELIIKPPDYEQVCKEIDDIFIKINKDNDFKDIRDNINDTFEVYSLNDINSFTQIDNILSKSLNNFNYTKKGDMILIDQYLSTTFNNKLNFLDFFENKFNPVLFKIIINKNNNKWLFLNKYSSMNNESEILIKRNSIFIVKDVNFVSIKLESEDKFIKILTLELCDFDITDYDNVKFTNSIRKLLTFNGFNKYDNILESPLCLKTLNYVYDNFFRNEFKESWCKPLSIEASLEVIIDGKPFSIPKCNHSLAHAVRVLCWVQLFCLQEEKYEGIFYNLSQDQNFVFKTCIASIFMISGRESEAGFGIEYNGECEGIEPNPYNRYLIASANNFVKYVKDEISYIYTDPEIEDYKFCLIYYFYVQTRSTTGISDTNIIEKINNPSNEIKFICQLFTKAHSNDLLRCRDKLPVFIPIDNKNIFFEHEKNNISKIVADLLICTGDRIWGNFNLYDKNGEFILNSNFKEELYKRDYRLFYFCSTNVEFCVSQVLNVTRDYFNDLVNDILEKSIVSSESIKEEFNLYLLSDDKFKSSYYKEDSIGTNSFIHDDNINNIADVEKNVRNSNIGITFYLPNKYYNKKRKDELNLFRKNGIYLNNLFISINIDNCNEIFFNNNEYENLENQKILYPQYFIKHIIIGKNHEINHDEIGKSDNLFNSFFDSLKLDNKINHNKIKKSVFNSLELNYKIKYLKYKNKYLQLKSKMY
jgi:hypothetical protein